MTDKKKKIWRIVRYIAIVIIGNMIASAGAALFTVPYGLVLGGTTGLGIFCRTISEDIPVTVVVYIANAVLYIVGVIFLGKKFAFSALLGTILYPTFMQIFGTLIGDTMLAGEDRLLASIFAAMLFGTGIGLVVRQGSSTGGTDIPPLIFQKYFGLNVSIGLWLTDSVVLIMQAVAFLVTKEPFENVLYGLVTVFLSSFVIELITPIGLKKMQVKIISEKYGAIREMILNELNLGVTVLYGQTGFLQEKCHMLLTVVSKRGLVKLKNATQKIDPNAFLMISVISEVRGRGYTIERVVLPKEVEKEDLHDVSFGDEEKPQAEVASAAGEPKGTN